MWLVPFVAGASQMRPAVFSCYAVISGVLWGISYPGIGYLGGSSWEFIYAMTIDGAFGLALSTRPILSAEGIHLSARDGDPPAPLRKIGKLYVELDLSQLIFGNLVVPELQAEDVVLAIAVNDPADAEDTDEGPLLAGDIETTFTILEQTAAKDLDFDGYPRTPPASYDRDTSWDVSPAPPFEICHTPPSPEIRRR